MKKGKSQQETPMTKAIRNNPWIVSTFVLGLFCLIFLVAQFIPEEIIDNLTKVEVNQSICSMIRATPSWVNERGQIQEGYINLTTSDVPLIVDKLIEDKIYFVYKPGCGWCERQIAEFGDSWIKYYNSGFTIEC